MYTIALFGAGKIGEAICGLLTPSGRYRVKVCDSNLSRAKHVAGMWPHCEALPLDLKNIPENTKLLDDCDAVISALPYYCNVEVASLALKTNTHYFDLTEDVATTNEILQIAHNAPVCFMPQCGLAPGFVSIAASHLINLFDSVDTVKMRVGALPIYPSNRLKYNLTWSTEGLINEYGNPCEIIESGKKVMAFPLEGYERFSLDGDEYEAFNTSGGLGTLCDTLIGRVRCLDYKSVRYPGHREYIAFLMNDLRFNEDRQTLKKVLERSVSTTYQDKCIILVEVRGMSKSHFVQRTYASTVYNTMLHGHHLSAIQITTASGICTPLDLVLSDATKAKKGLLRNEDVSFMDFINHEFGKYFKDDKALKGISV